MDEKKIKILKIVLLCFVLLLLIILTMEIMPFFKNLYTQEGRVDFKNKIENLGYKGALVLLSLIVVQVFLAIIPGEPVEIIAGMCYGPLWGTILAIIGFSVGSLIIFFLVRKFGKKFIYSFIKKENIEKFENNKFFNEKSKIEATLFILFFIPGTPKDILIYISGILPIKPLNFFVISTIARIPSILSSTYAGSNIMDTNWKLIGLSYGAITVVSGIVLILFRRARKKREIAGGGSSSEESGRKLWWKIINLLTKRTNFYTNNLPY